MRRDLVHACLRPHAIPNASLDERSLWVTPGLLANLGYRGYRKVGSHVRGPPTLQKSSLV